jgi:hypothetical protein
MFASLFTDAVNLDTLIDRPWLVAVFAFQVWMFIDAVRREEWLWALFIFIGFGISAVLYYFLVYRVTPSATRGFELPGAHSRKRIKELQAKIHHLDKAHHHSQLGDIYFQQGKLDLAEASYRAALERDGQDLDTRSHLGQCLLHLKRPAEARPLLEGVVAEKPQHEYGYTQMALAETLTVLNETDDALKIWQRVTENNSYPRAKVQLAELYLAKNQPQLARPQLEEVVNDDVHAPAFQRKRDRVWVRKAKSLLAKAAR